MCLILTLQESFCDKYFINNLYNKRTQISFHISHGKIHAILKMLIHLSTSIFTLKYKKMQPHRTRDIAL